MNELNPENPASAGIAQPIASKPYAETTSNSRHGLAKSGRAKPLLYAFGALLLLGATLAWLFTRQPNLQIDAPKPIPLVGNQANSGDTAGLEARLNDAQQINRVLREQALALSQRMDLLEEAVAGLRRGSAPSAESFKLDEAQYLLSLAETRLDLFSDPQSAARALELADNLLAGISDPALANVRQTLSIELDVVRAAPVNDVPALTGRLRGLIQDLPNLPILIEAPTTSRSRLFLALDRYLVVRREGEAMPVLGRSPWAVREGLTLEFERAQLALERQQPQGWQNALATAVTMAERGLKPNDTAVESFVSRLRSLAKTALAPDPPKLGATLRALRRLREGPSIATLPADVSAEIDPASSSPSATDVSPIADKNTDADQASAAQTALPAEAHSGAPTSSAAKLPIADQGQIGSDATQPSADTTQPSADAIVIPPQ